MSRFFTITKHIDAPPPRVWEVLVDVARWPEWAPTMLSVERLDAGPFQVGSRAKVRQPRLPQTVWQVTGLVDGRSFVWEAGGPGMTTVARHEVVDDGDGCKVTLSIEQSGALGALAGLVWGGLTQRYIELEAASLDKRVTGAPAA